MFQLAHTVEGIQRQGTIVFVSGFVGSRRSWDRDFYKLGKHFKIIALDTLGFGESPKPDISYTVEDHVKAIHETLAAQEVTTAHFVGHSMGCLLSLAYAAYYPAQVDSLALLALPYFESESQARETIRNGSLFNRWLAMDTAMAKAACTLMCMLRPVLRLVAPYLVRHVPHVVAKDALDHNWQSYSRTMRNVIFRGDSRKWFQAFLGRVLLVHGTRDTTAPIDNVRGLASPPRVQLLCLEADHGLIFSHSGWIAERLREFFDVPAPADLRGNRAFGIDQQQ